MDTKCIVIVRDYRMVVVCVNVCVWCDYVCVYGYYHPKHAIIEGNIQLRTYGWCANQSKQNLKTILTMSLLIDNAWHAKTKKIIVTIVRRVEKLHKVNEPKVTAPSTITVANRNESVADGDL